MLDSFLKIYRELINASGHPDEYLGICSLTEFRGKVKQFAVALGEIDAVTKSLHANGHTLAFCR